MIKRKRYTAGPHPVIEEPDNNDMNIVNLGPDLSICDSIHGYRNKTCPYCQKKGTPRFISFRFGSGEWICGDEECINFYILAYLDRKDME